ncbi:hypothetical protein BH09BAC3_BH09BAC3_14890 [soil metagenome]
MPHAFRDFVLFDVDRNPTPALQFGRQVGCSHRGESKFIGWLLPSSGLSSVVEMRLRSNTALSSKSE